jgi:hypothetical protein
MKFIIVYLLICILVYFCIYVYWCYKYKKDIIEKVPKISIRYVSFEEYYNDFIFFHIVLSIFWPFAAIILIIYFIHNKICKLIKKMFKIS